MGATVHDHARGVSLQAVCREGATYIFPEVSGQELHFTHAVIDGEAITLTKPLTLTASDQWVTPKLVITLE
jgi:hypothetical protein